MRRKRKRVAAHVEGEQQPKRKGRLTLMDLAEGTARIMPREEVVERLLARAKP